MGFEIVMRAKGRLRTFVAGNAGRLVDNQHEPVAVEQTALKVEKGGGMGRRRDHAFRITLPRSG